MLRQIVSSHWFALADLLLVILSGLVWIFRPEIGIFPIIAIALIPWALRWMAGLALFKGNLIDWLVIIFLITAWIGFWAAYDWEAAWSKVWFVVLAVLLYYALSSQPVENFEWICALVFCIGVGVAIYFFLTHDFVALPRKVEIVNRLGRWMMGIIPRPGWPPIHPNYVAGMAAIMTPFILYPAGKLVKRKTLLSAFARVIIFIGSIVALSAIFMATSRGVIMAIASAAGLWVVWWIANLIGGRLQVRREAVFPSLVLISLCAVVLFLYSGPANSSSVSTDDYYFGTGSRSELFARSMYLLLDFPYTGGGLGTFPGLFSFYMLGIPNLNVPNSHNLFLDVAIEQGLLGGLAFLIIFLMSIWFTARAITEAKSSQVYMFGWLILFTLVIAFVHGMVDDYLYNGNGTMLSLVLPGLSSTMQPRRKNVVPFPRIVIVITLALTGFLMLNLNRVRSAWYADIGAVQMAKVELAGFPTNQWIEPSILPKLEQADASLHSALQADPTNRTANHRLGLITMLRGDFLLATAYLEKANQEAPNHRGIIKSLGYCYVWEGNMEKALFFLDKIPEAKEELGIYVWWWGMQGRPDLAQKASTMSSKLEAISHQD